jgi:hypothetical protein
VNSATSLASSALAWGGRRATRDGLLPRVPHCSPARHVRVLLKLPSAQSPFACAKDYLAHRDLGGPRQQVLTHLHCSYGLMRQSSTLLLPRWYPQHEVCAGCRQPLLGEGPSRRCLCASFPACLDPYPGSLWSASTRFFLHNIGLPLVRTGSAVRKARTAISVRRPFRGCSHFLMFRPAGLLATQIAPTDTVATVWQP